MLNPPILPPKRPFNQSIHFSPLLLSHMRPGNSKPPGLPPPPSPVGLQNNKSGMWLFAYNLSMTSITHVLPRHMSPKRPGKVWSVSILVRVSPPCSQSFIHTCVLSLGITPSHPMLPHNPFFSTLFLAHSYPSFHSIITSSGKQALKPNWTRLAFLRTHPFDLEPSYFMTRLAQSCVP